MITQLVVVFEPVTQPITQPVDFAYFEKDYKLIAVDLRKQKALDADSRAIQQIIFTGKIISTVENTKVKIYHILEQSKETILEFAKGTTNVL